MNENEKAYLRIKLKLVIDSCKKPKEFTKLSKPNMRIEYKKLYRAYIHHLTKYEKQYKIKEHKEQKEKERQRLEKIEIIRQQEIWRSRRTKRGKTRTKEQFYSN